MYERCITTLMWKFGVNNKGTPLTSNLEHALSDDFSDILEE